MALATVVHVEGSSYRRPGARMLVTEDGELTGAISGGCLEGDALRKALLAIHQQQNKLVTYNSMDEEDHTIGVQLGCNGIVHILFEPVDVTKENHPVALLEKAAAQKRNSVLITLFSLDRHQPQGGTCKLITTEACYGDMDTAIAERLTDQDIATALAAGRAIVKTPFSEQLPSALLDVIQPPVELIIAGAGNDAFPLVQIAGVLGWNVTVTDGRKTHATADRFPTARVIAAKPEALTSSLEITPHTVFVLMSHNYNYDLAMLKELVTTDAGYIGVLGPKQKLQRMLADIHMQGIDTGSLRHVYGPTGLDIGAEAAEEIALSIVAEIKAVLAGKNAARLRDKQGFIHEKYPSHFSLQKS